METSISLITGYEQGCLNGKSLMASLDGMFGDDGSIGQTGAIVSWGTKADYIGCNTEGMMIATRRRDKDSFYR